MLSSRNSASRLPLFVRRGERPLHHATKREAPQTRKSGFWLMPTCKRCKESRNRLERPGSKLDSAFDKRTAALITTTSKTWRQAPRVRERSRHRAVDRNKRVDCKQVQSEDIESTLPHRRHLIWLRARHQSSRFSHHHHCQTFFAATISAQA